MKNWLTNQFRTFRKIYVWWRDQLTVMGKVVFLIMVCSLPALADAASVLAIVFIGSSVVLLVAAGTSFLFRPRLAVRATHPRNWMCGETRTLRLDITNHSNLPAYDVQFGLVPTEGIWAIECAGSFAHVLAPGETVTVSMEAKALRRGVFQLPDFRATTTFPLNLRRRSEEYKVRGEVLILPFYRTLRSFDLVRSVSHLSRGQDLSAQTVGMTGEYVGSREYQPGLAVRKWDYASWARLGQPVVREFSEPHHPSVAVMLDTFFPPDQCKRSHLLSELEAILSLAASVVEALFARAHTISLLTIGDRLFASDCRVAAGDQLAVLEHFALAEPCPAASFTDLMEQLDRFPITWDLAIILSHHWGADQENLFQLVTRQNAVGTRILVAADKRRGEFRQDGEWWQVTASQIRAGEVAL